LPYSYLWSDGQTTATATGLVGGGYTVTISDYNGCTIIHNNLSVTQPSVEFVANVSVVNEIECFGENGSITAVVSGGSPLYTYTWDANTGNQTLATAINIPSGAYYITVTDANGCTTIGTGTLYQPEALMLVTDTVVGVSCKNAKDGSISISTYQGTGTHAYLWSNTAVTEDLSGLTAGLYELTVTDENGCSLTESFTVLNSEIPCYELEIPSAFTPNNDGTNDSWEIGGVEAVANIEIEIFNRWGQSIFSFTGTGLEYADIENQWDGTFNGADVPLGSYVYILKLGETEEEQYNGTITIIR
jgi:gliding motility-associated-like protein